MIINKDFQKLYFARKKIFKMKLWRNR